MGLVSGATLLALGAPAAFAAMTPVKLGTAASYAVLASQTVTNTGPSSITGSVGVSPKKAITGFPPGKIHGGSFHRGDADAANARAALTTAYNTAAGETPQTQVGPDLAGQTLGPGTYGNSNAAGTLGLTGNLTLDGQNKKNAVFVFQADSTLMTDSNTNINLIRGADWCNVYWKVGSSATLGTDSNFVGNILALTSITLTTHAKVEGRVLARNGAVTLDSNTITRPACTLAAGSGGGGGTGGGGGNGGGGNGGGGNGGGSGGNGGGSGGSGGNGSGSPGGGNRLDTGSTTVPQGHPDTGRMPTQADGSGNNTLLLLGGGLALGGAIFASSRATRRRPRRIAR